MIKSFFILNLQRFLILIPIKNLLNLNWQNYEGMYVPEYIIYKGDTPFDLVEVARKVPDEVLTTWTDVNVTGIHYYRVGVELASDCVPTGNVVKKAVSDPYSHSMSNIENNLRESIFDYGAIYVHTLPNPFNDYTTIQFDNPGNKPYELTVFDISGKIVQKLEGITGSRIVFERRSLPSGFYTFELRGEQRFVGKFVIE